MASVFDYVENEFEDQSLACAFACKLARLLTSPFPDTLESILDASEILILVDESLFILVNQPLDPHVPGGVSKLFGRNRDHLHDGVHVFLGAVGQFNRYPCLVQPPSDLMRDNIPI
ncbi:hypothetical protein N7454_010665 [Penicillium verhagenii]|nr:hypothetical protein N7454_010665 [Penicillium verhagenii]